MPSGEWIDISIKKQQLRYYRDDQLLMDVAVATATNGPGEQFGSECTPRGQHYIRAKIGAGCPENTVFIARRPTGEIYQQAMKQHSPQRDWILTRILWLCGLEPGRNRLGKVDTMRRYIYIHGCPDDDPMGIPSSHGCIKMRNTDILRLFDLLSVGTRVEITE